jgi:hypothetical protein
VVLVGVCIWKNRQHSSTTLLPFPSCRPHVAPPLSTSFSCAVAKGLTYGLCIHKVSLSHDNRPSPNDSDLLCSWPSVLDSGSGHRTEYAAYIEYLSVATHFSSLNIVEPLILSSREATRNPIGTLPSDWQWYWWMSRRDSLAAVCNGPNCQKYR